MKVEEGSDEGDVCNRSVVNGAIPDGATTIRCFGTMEFPEVENCSCHILPPCFACTENKLTCSECGVEVL